MIIFSPTTITDAVSALWGQPFTQLKDALEIRHKLLARLYPNTDYTECVTTLESTLKDVGTWLSEKKHHSCNLTWLLVNSEVAVVKISRMWDPEKIIGCHVSIVNTTVGDIQAVDELVAKEQEKLLNLKSLQTLLLESIWYQTTPTPIIYRESYPLNRFYEHGMRCVTEQNTKAYQMTYVIPIGGDHAERHPHIRRMVQTAREAVTRYTTDIQKTGEDWHDFSAPLSKLMGEGRGADDYAIFKCLRDAADIVTKSDVYYDLVDMTAASFRRHAIPPDTVNRSKSVHGSIVRAIDETELTNDEKVVMLLGTLPNDYLITLLAPYMEKSSP